jgi:hypothetical protein
MMISLKTEGPVYPAKARSRKQPREKGISTLQKPFLTKPPQKLS